MKIFTKQTEGLKVLVLSDLHIFSIEDMLSVEKLLESLKKNKYDAIYLVGDILDATNILSWSDKVTGRLFELMAFLGHIAPTYIVYGSHDLAYKTTSTKHPWLADEKTFKTKFLNHIAGYQNINVLENETKEIKEGYTISGINPSLSYAMNTPDGAINCLLGEISNFEFLNRLEPDKTNTLLCHYPNAIMTLNEKTDLLKNIDCSVAGHNHNGCTQFKKIIPVEAVLNLFRQKNRGLITPGKSVKLRDTKILRGTVDLSKRNTLVMNPAVKTMAANTGPLEKLDGLFYKGYTVLEYIPEKESLSRK